MILFYSSKIDATAQMVSQELLRRQVSVKWLEPSDFLKSSHLSHRLGGTISENILLFHCGKEQINLNEASVVYHRRPGNVIFDEKFTDVVLQNWLNNENKNYLRETLEMIDVRWLPGSPSLIHRLENDKLKELLIASKVGLKLPDTIVTNDPKFALDFYRKHQGRVISKRYRISVTPYRGVEFATPTSPVSLRDVGYIRDIHHSPTLFQEYIVKEKELRVTIVGEKTVAAEIDSQKTHRTRHDWRNYDRKRTPYKKHLLPNEIHQHLVNLIKELGLNYGTADLIITPKGEYIFLEVNPSGQYLWIENAINVDITGMICDELINLSKN